MYWTKAGFVRLRARGFAFVFSHSGFVGVVTGRGNPTRHSVAGSKRLQVRNPGGVFSCDSEVGAVTARVPWTRAVAVKVCLVTGSMDLAGSQKECSDPAACSRT